MKNVAVGTLTAAELVCPLGYDIRNACAAARAGLSRISEHPTYLVDTDDLAAGGAPLDVHCAELISGGFEELGVLVRLTNSVVERSNKAGMFENCEASRTRFYFSLPPGALITDPRAVAERLLQGALDAGHLPTRFSVGNVAVSGGNGVTECVSAISADLLEGRIDCAVLIAVDSLNDEATLDGLEDTGRVKTPTQAAGLQPSEAAVAIRVDGIDSSTRVACGSLMIGQPKFVEIQEKDAEIPMPNAKAISKLISDIGIQAKEAISWVISDQNGELWRANQWGSALMYLGDLPDITPPEEVWMPAMSFGETRAAFAGLALCVASQAFHRGYAPYANGVIVTSDIGGTHAALPFALVSQ